MMGYSRRLLLTCYQVVLKEKRNRIMIGIFIAIVLFIMIIMENNSLPKRSSAKAFILEMIFLSLLKVMIGIKNFVNLFVQLVKILTRKID